MARELLLPQRRVWHKHQKQTGPIAGGYIDKSEHRKVLVQRILEYGSVSDGKEESIIESGCRS